MSMICERPKGEGVGLMRTHVDMGEVKNLDILVDDING